MTTIAEQYAAATIWLGATQGEGRCADCGATDEHTARCPMWARHIADNEREQERGERQ